MTQQRFDDKLEWEWKLFQSGMLAQSRESLFSMAEIISVKRNIYRVLKESSFTDEEMKLLMSYHNMLDYLHISLPEKENQEELMWQIRALLYE